jgi:hypothetical protein
MSNIPTIQVHVSMESEGQKSTQQTKEFSPPTLQRVTPELQAAGSCTCGCGASAGGGAGAGA